MPIRRTDFRQADFKRLHEQWCAFYPDKYHVDVELLERNTVGCPLFDWGASAIALDGEKVIGFVTVKRSAGGFYKVVDPDDVHINAIAFTDPDIGVDLMTYAKRVLRDRGYTRLRFGQDEHHFFPGCPSDIRTLCSFLLVEGFESDGVVHDLEANLANYKNPARAVKGVELRPLKSKEHSGLVRFFDSTFPGRWKFDVMEKIEAEGIDKCVFGLVKDGEIQGFALIQSREQKRPIGGAVWHESLGENWGALGPIGISTSMRGRGFGDALLGASLEALKSRGVERCIIDWTGLVDFYGRHGFEVTRTYESLSLGLEMPS